MGLTLGEILRPEWGITSIPDMLDVLHAGLDKGARPDGTSLPEGGPS